MNQVNYGYNAENLRTYKTMNGKYTGYVWNGSNLAAETNESAVTNTYTYGMGGIVSANVNGATSLFLKNVHGDVVGTTDINGTRQKSYRYDAFGNEQNPNETDSNPFRYAGEYFDQETGNTYLRNRYYAASVGRFITEDPVRDGMNWYAYAGNNPVKSTNLRLPASGRDVGWLAEENLMNSLTEMLKFKAGGSGLRSSYINRNSVGKASGIHKLDNFPYVYQGGMNLCWAADIAMVVEWFTGKPISFIQIAKDKNGETDFDHGTSMGNIYRLMEEQKYLEGSGYRVVTQTVGRDDLTFAFFKEQIDSGKPVILSYSTKNEGHVVVVTGYNLNTSTLLIHDSAESNGEYLPFDLEKYKEYAVSISAIQFEKID